MVAPVCGERKPITLSDIMRLVDQYRDEWITSIEVIKDGDAPYDSRVRGQVTGDLHIRIRNLIDLYGYEQFNAGANSISAQFPSEYCQCRKPLWWQDEDAFGKPVNACEVCGKFQSEEDAVRDYEVAMDADADAALTRLQEV